MARRKKTQGSVCCWRMCSEQLRPRVDPLNPVLQKDFVFDHLPTSVWWDANGPLKTLHAINPARLQFIRTDVDLSQATILDAGCGGGILAETLAAQGARVNGIDTSAAAITAARTHAPTHMRGNLNYVQGTVESVAQSEAGRYDAVTCMELLEHVTDPEKLVQDCAGLLRPGGIVFFSTLDRRFVSWLSAIVTAEYVMGLLPPGTHDYSRFIRPAELAEWVEGAGLQVTRINGLAYIPGLNHAVLTRKPKTNYLLAARQPNDCSH